MAIDNLKKLEKLINSELSSKVQNSSIKNGAKFCITDNKNYTQNEKVVFVKNIYDYLIGLAKIKRDL